ncbi:MAG: ComEA family DNA-binding protein [Ilumatobacter sp.]|uniref:ComEA family DNA-binding protein n=1 Tax=Ilumatobacter sp. TaxID=1967498 RepID=UPI003297108A
MRQPIEDSPSTPVAARPVATRSAPDRLRDWVDWFGLTRLVTSAVAVLVVCVGGWWLVRTPQAPPESSLPVAAGDVAAGSVTLPPPSTIERVPDSAPDPTDDVDGVVVVHVAGAVMVSGVFELDSGSRVADAIAQAGGPSPDADPGALNLAAPLVDGTRVYVPMVGEEVPVEDLPSVSPVDEVGSAPAGPIDVNRASASELESLPGVGPATAAAIITERDRNGPFVSFDDLERVPGIGPAKLSALDGLVTT